jgi:hypothetical protein
MVGGLTEGLDLIPGHLLASVTFDQGSEWANWETIADTYRIACWFCDPHSPWQRGQIENLNRQWRWWFPRGTDLAGIAPAHADHAATIINGQRRRRRSAAHRDPLTDGRSPNTTQHPHPSPIAAPAEATHETHRARLRAPAINSPHPTPIPTYHADTCNHRWNSPTPLVSRQCGTVSVLPCRSNPRRPLALGRPDWS